MINSYNPLRTHPAKISVRKEQQQQSNRTREQQVNNLDILKQRQKQTDDGMENETTM